MIRKCAKIIASSGTTVLIAFFIAQCIYCFIPRPILAMGDEVIYKQLALEIYELKPVSTFHYPIMYPLLLAPAFIFGKEYFYYGMIILNIFYKVISLAIINRLLEKCMKKRIAGYVLAMLAFSPPMFIWSKYIMSENAMSPLVVITILYYVNYHRKVYDDDVGNKGIILYTLIAASLAVFLYWTKYLSLVLFPVFFFYWTDAFNIRGICRITAWNRLMRISALFILMVVGYIIGYAWIYSVKSETAMTFSLLKNTMGFSIGSGPENSGYLLLPEFKWLVAYFLYVFLSTAVLYPTFIFMKRQLTVVRLSETLFFGFFACMLLFVAARHSTYAGIDNGVMIKLVCRYTAYIALFLYVLWGMIISADVSRTSTNISGKQKTILVGTELLMVYISYAVLYMGGYKSHKDWLGLYRGMENLGFYRIGSIMLFVTSVGIISIVWFYKPRMCVNFIVAISVLNISTAIYEANMERKRPCEEAYYKNIHLSELQTGLLRDTSQSISLFFNRIEIAGPMQYADDFYDNNDQIRWCPIVYWESHDFEIHETDWNLILVMEKDIDQNRYKNRR